jgi:hypothetical protein
MTSGDCPGRTPPFLDVKRHASTKAPHETELRLKTRRALHRPGAGPDRELVLAVLHAGQNSARHFFRLRTPGRHAARKSKHRNVTGVWGRVRSHRSRNRGTEYVSESGIKWMSGGIKRQRDRVLAWGLGFGRTG